MSDNRFEQHAEKLSRSELNEYYKDIDDGTILKKLIGRGAKLLSAPRGAGKSMLLIRAYYNCFEDDDSPFPVYTNYSQYFKVDDAGHNKSNSLIIFRRWVLSKILMSSNTTASSLGKETNEIFKKYHIDIIQLGRFVESLEGGTFVEKEIELSPDRTCEVLLEIAKLCGRKRVILLLDDAAHVFTPEFQREFFDVFRGLSKFLVSPKAAVYPGVTSYGARFNIGHDAEIIPVGLEPESSEYLNHMIGLLTKRLLPDEIQSLKKQDGLIELLAFAASGIPRAFILMASHYLDSHARNPSRGASQAGWEAINEWNKYIETLYESISIKVPRFKNYIQCGTELYHQLLNAIKLYNYRTGKHSIHIAVEEKNSPRYDMLIQFMEYAGILFRRKQISQGDSGLYNKYLLHLGLQIQHKTLLRSRGKSYRQQAEFIQHPDVVNHRIGYTSLLLGKLDERCSLELPPCSNCGTPRLNSEAKYCMSCGQRLSDASIYSEIIKQPISVLKISEKKLTAMIKSGNFTTISDLLTENSIEKLLEKFTELGATGLTKFGNKHKNLPRCEMSILDILSPNSLLQESHISPELFFTTTTESVSKSPIDSYLYQTRDLIRLATPDQLNNHPGLGGLAVLGIVSYVERYVRTLLNKLVGINSQCRFRCQDMQIRFGSIDWYQPEQIGLALMDRLALSGSKEIKERINNFLAIDITKNEAIKEALSDYTKLCEIRHCIVHSAGYIGAFNAQNLGLSDNYNTSIANPEFTTIHASLASMENMVRLINQHVCNSVFEDGFIPEKNGIFIGEWEQVRDVFYNNLSIFWCELDLGPIQNPLVEGFFIKLQDRFT